MTTKKEGHCANSDPGNRPDNQIITTSKNYRKIKTSYKYLDDLWDEYDSTDDNEKQCRIMDKVSAYLQGRWDAFQLFREDRQ